MEDDYLKTKETEQIEVYLTLWYMHKICIAGTLLKMSKILLSQEVHVRDNGPKFEGQGESSLNLKLYNVEAQLRSVNI